MNFDLSSSFSAVGEGIVIVLVSVAAVGSLLVDIVLPVSSKFHFKRSCRLNSLVVAVVKVISHFDCC